MNEKIQGLVSKVPEVTVVFWVIKILATTLVLTRPLGAVIGDFLDKPLDHRGLALSRYSASATLLVLIVAFIYIFPHAPAKRTH